MNLSEVKTKTITELVEIAEKLGLEDVGRLKKQDIIFQILKKQADDGIDTVSYTHLTLPTILLV